MRPLLLLWNWGATGIQTTGKSMALELCRIRDDYYDKKAKLRFVAVIWHLLKNKTSNSAYYSWKGLKKVYKKSPNHQIKKLKILEIYPH